MLLYLKVGWNIYWELNFQFWVAIVFIYKICQLHPSPLFKSDDFPLNIDSYSQNAGVSPIPFTLIHPVG